MAKKIRNLAGGTAVASAIGDEFVANRSNVTMKVLLSGSALAGNYTTTATAAGTTTLTSSSTEVQYFTGTTTQTIVMPVVSTLYLGKVYTIVNNSTGAVTVNSSGSNLIAVVPPGGQITFRVILITGTTAASWSYNIATVGTATNDSAGSGMVGEVVSSTVAFSSPVTSISTGTAYNVTSISVPAGDWDITGVVGILSGASTTLVNYSGWSSTTSATFPSNNRELTATFNFGNSGVSFNSSAQNCPIPNIRYSFASTTTVYLSFTSSFTSVNTASIYGYIKARRVR